MKANGEASAAELAKARRAASSADDGDACDADPCYRHSDCCDGRDSSCTCGVGYTGATCDSCEEGFVGYASSVLRRHVPPPPPRLGSCRRPPGPPAPPLSRTAFLSLSCGAWARVTTLAYRMNCGAHLYMYLDIWLARIFIDPLCPEHVWSAKCLNWSKVTRAYVPRHSLAPPFSVPWGVGTCHCWQI